MKKLILIPILLFIISCDAPTHRVAEGYSYMVVYGKVPCKNTHYGNNLYSVTDATGKGWGLFSFSEYNLGDTLLIVRKNDVPKE
jgi:hypothetical protein